jgi:hypothetical protein
MVDTAKSTRIFTNALTWFFLRTVPSSKKAKPACIASTMMAPSRMNKASVPCLIESMGLCLLCGVIAAFWPFLHQRRI